ncbi:DUF1302 domain-containing protein [Pseudomonas sp. EL_65y_Pfl2_R95]|uniref:DUF1302 domain-containing protein n=1 Tax=Pseudomonas sp. EL_65y_Pfl2_R95 TaxID=3088698 RepID=UPI0030DC12C0
MTQICSRTFIARTLLALSPLALAVMQQVHADEFQWGEVNGRANGSISVGAIWSAENPNGNFINQNNANSIGRGHAGEFNPNSARNVDDSRLNFGKGDLVSSPVTILGEVEFKWQNYGAFIRGKTWYDYTLNNHNVDYGHSANGYQTNSTLNDSHFDDKAKFQGIELLDAYVFGDFELGDHPLNARLGNQVVNWGEGLFFQNGINAINPVDIAALRRPGSQLKEALVPVPMLYANFGLTDNLSLETFYQLQWESSTLEGCGTYFSSNDYISDGCFGVPRAGIDDASSYAAGQYINRGLDQEPDDSGQFGFSLRYFADAIDTEFGAYAMNIHSRTPYASITTDLYGPTGPGWRDPNLAPDNAEKNASYYADFPEDIRIFGLSFSTSVLGTSVFGEYSYRPNQPVQLATGDLIPAFAGNPGLVGAAIGQPLTLGEDALNAVPGSTYNGYDRLKISQLSLGFIKSFPQILGADSLNLIGEAAMKYMHDLPDQSERRYNKSEIYGSDLADGSVNGCTGGVPVDKYKKYGCTKDGFTSQFSWGYRMRAQLNYPGAIAGVNLSPFMAFGQDVKGWSYDSNFVEDRLLGSVGLRADYLQDYSAEVSWSGSGNTPFASTDKDFISLSLRMGF